jgi:hypothetical protein
MPITTWDDEDHPDGDLYGTYCDHFCTDDICRTMGGCAWRDVPESDERTNP